MATRTYRRHTRSSTNPSKKRKTGTTAPRPKSKHWCFTINNYTKEDGRVIQNSANLFRYIVLGKETGDNGTLHMQGYAVFKNLQRMTGVKKIFPRAHLEIKSKNSTYAECIDYCKKDGEFMEVGVAPITQSDRNKQKWQEAFDLALSGRINDIDKGMLIRYYHAFKRIRQDNPPAPPNLSSKKNYWILAPTMYGKSTYARKRWGPQSRLYDKSPNKWWTGYKGEENVLCDDFGPKQCQYLGWYIKRWADVFSFPMETKGGGTQIRPKRIIVTSQYSIEDCFSDDKECAAVGNRFQTMNLQHWRSRIKF